MPLCAGCASEPQISVQIVTHDLQFAGHIFIGGSVNNPGIYPFSASDTVGDLLQAAGGLSEGGDLSRIELAILVNTEAYSTQKININTAEEWLLQALPGIGPSSAASIVSFRQEYGYFRSVADLSKVPGIGPATIAKIANLITVNSEAPPVWP